MSRARLFLPSLVVLMAGLGLSGLAWFHTKQQNEIRMREAFGEAVVRTQEQLMDNLRIYERGLRGAKSVVMATEGRISRRIFNDYARFRDFFKTEYPGIRGFGFIRRVPLAEEAVFLKAARADDMADFSIRQIQPGSLDRFVIQYIEPYDSNAEAVGLDIGSEPSRRAAAIAAARNGEMIMTGPITLAQASAKKNQGFLMLLPLYTQGMPVDSEEAREAATYAWVYAPLVIDEVMENFTFSNSVSIRLSDISRHAEPKIFYAQDDFSAHERNVHASVSTHEVGGRLWKLEINARPALMHQAGVQSPWLIAGLFAAISMALSLLLYFFLRHNDQLAQAAAKQAQHAALAKATALQKAIQDNAGYALITTDTQGTVTSFNPAAEQLLGYTSSEIVGKLTPALFHDPAEVALRARALSQELGREILPGFETFVAKTVDGKSDSNEWTYICKDGSRLPVWLTVSALRDDLGRVFGFLGIAADLTKRKQADERFRRVVDAAPTPLLITDRAGTILTVNAAACAAFAYASEELLGRNIEILIPPQQRSVHAMHLQGYTAEPVARPMGKNRQLMALRKSGDQFPVEIGLSPISIDQTEHIMALVFDISERLAYESNLEAAKVAAEDAARAKSEFLANMSHEIRTPMNAIMGLTQLVLESDLDAGQAEYLKKARAASQALLGILNDILDFSKIEAGRLSLEEHEFRLEEALEGCVNLFRLEAEKKNLELIVDLDARLSPRVIGDSLRLSQVLNNLVSNAIKFTERGEICVKATLAAIETDKEVIEFSVRDTGSGLSPEQASRLFKPFTQADSSTTRKHGGTGLGLAICRHLVEMMGGSIGLQSEPGVGTTFTFRVRMRRGAALPTAEHDLNGLVGLRVLVVDDHETTLAVMQDMLKRWQAEVSRLSAGRALVPLLQDAHAAGKPFDLLILDWEMPEMGGDQVLQAIDTAIQSGALPGAPHIIVSTALQPDESPSSLDGRKVGKILSKPVTPSALLNAINLTCLKERTPVPSRPLLTDYQQLAKPLQGMHILLAEDNLLNQQVAIAFLNKSGLKVSLANNGKEAVAMVRGQTADERYAAILMDMQMPEMDGIEAARAIRGLPDCADLPIIAMTANAMSEDRQACLEAGMSDHIAKPIVARHMIETLLKWLIRDSNTEGAGRAPS